MTLDEARALMHEWTASPALRVHMECVRACTSAYATLLAPDQAERWAVTGLLHDMDYEKHPSREEHPRIGVAHLEKLGVDEEIRTAILAHADYTGTPRSTPLAKSLFAVDELAGFIVACAKVRPNGVSDLEASSVRKKLKDKAFAAAVSRTDIATGTAELAQLLHPEGVKDPIAFETEHYTRCIQAIRDEGSRLSV
jgi:predicted hydrolase (HD superfamily)